MEEASFQVLGGMVWYEDVLVVGCLDLADDAYQVHDTCFLTDLFS